MCKRRISPTCSGVRREMDPVSFKGGGQHCERRNAQRCRRIGQEALPFRSSHTARPLSWEPTVYAFLGEKPTVDALAAEMVEFPPGCSPDQKSYLGFFDADEGLVAVLDLVRGYPVEECAFIGFFMVDASRQGMGVGSLLVSRLLDRLQDGGVSRVRLAYVKGNEQSRRFWEKCGFVDAGAPVDQGDYKVVPMERRLM